MKKLNNLKWVFIIIAVIALAVALMSSMFIPFYVIVLAVIAAFGVGYGYAFFTLKKDK